ncbi:Alpha/beta hydrolase, variant 2 [Balamuthia mandrillaris]
MEENEEELDQPPQHPQEHEPPKPQQQQQQREHGPASFFASIALSLVWACVILLVALAGFNQAMLSLEASHAAWASPPGNLFDVGGYKLHLYCKGARTAQKPLTVVLIPREGMSHNEHWSAVESLSSTMRACTYDRNGLGFSQTAPSYHPVNTRSLTTMAKELETLLKKGGETGAFLLVGRGLGANIAEQFAIDFTAQVGGVVLLDGMHADMFSLDEGSWLHYWHKHLVDDLLYSSYLMSAMGLNRVWHAMGLMSPAIAMIEAPAHVPSQQRYFLSQSKHCRAVTFSSLLSSYLFSSFFLSSLMVQSLYPDVGRVCQSTKSITTTSQTAQQFSSLSTNDATLL